MLSFLFSPMLQFFVWFMVITLIAPSSEANMNQNPIQKINVSNGKNLLLWSDKSVPLITINISFNIGSIHDPEGKKGLANLATSVLNEATPKYDSTEFSDILEENGIRISIESSRDATVITLQTISESLDLATELLIDMLREPVFDESDTNIVQQEILTSIAYASQIPSHVAGDHWWSHVFAGTAMAYTTVGVEDDLLAVSKADMIGFVNNMLARNFYISIAGDINTDKAQDFANKFQSFISTHHKTNKGELAEISEYPYIYQPKATKQVEFPSDECSIVFGQQGISRNDKDYYAFSLLNHIIGGGGFSARLMEEIREKNGLTYGISTLPLQLGDGKLPLWLGSVNTNCQNVDQVISLIKDQWQYAANKTITEEELQAAKDYVIGSFVLSLDNTAKLANLMNILQNFGLGADYLEKREAYLNSVTLEQINDLAASLMTVDNITFIVVGSPTQQ
jgi:zinc protease